MDNGGLKRELLSAPEFSAEPQLLGHHPQHLELHQTIPFAQSHSRDRSKACPFLKTVLTLTYNMADRFPSLDEIDAGMLIGT